MLFVYLNHTTFYEGLQSSYTSICFLMNFVFLFHSAAKQCSEKFLSTLLDGWPEDLKLNYLCHAVSKFVSSGSFQVYVFCCGSQKIIEKTLEHLM